MYSKPRQSPGFMCSQAFGARKRTLSPCLAMSSCRSSIFIVLPAPERRMRHLTTHVGRYPMSPDHLSYLNHSIGLPMKPHPSEWPKPASKWAPSLISASYVCVHGGRCLQRPPRVFPMDWVWFGLRFIIARARDPEG